MKIITHTCPTCGTIVAANVLEEYRRMKCPRTGCQTVLDFDDLAQPDRDHFLDHRENYQL